MVQAILVDREVVLDRLLFVVVAKVINSQQEEKGVPGEPEEEPEED
jgi:hypothetical protein